MMMCMAAFGVCGVVWAVVGYSLAFSTGGNYIGVFSFAFLNNVGVDAKGTIPHVLFMAYQASFAVVTATLIAGAIVDRMRFGPYLAFITLWTVVVYAPIAHWVWGGGWLSKLGVLDFAGGTVVHINAGIAATVAAIVVGRCKDFGFLFFTMNRLAEISNCMTKGLALGPGQEGPADGAIIALPAVSTRLLGAIERLDKRIADLESPNASPQLLAMPKDGLRSNGNGNGKHQTIVSGDGTAAQIEIDTPAHNRVSVMLGKGQTLLNLGQAENALACFEQVLESEPENADALVKKGTALERLRRWEEALQCYDRAIAANRGMTLAYLYKGGVYNQLERFSEALECYEQALRTQQRAPVAVG
jgi:predicted negative regulator of RcsB-dependent stress response